MPITHITFLIACLAIAGIPPFAGFFSKEEILAAAFENNKFVFVLAIITAGITAFYMFRLYFNIFGIQKRKTIIPMRHMVKDQKQCWFHFAFWLCAQFLLDLFHLDILFPATGKSYRLNSTSYFQ